MADQYYRVKVEWPLPHFVREFACGPTPVISTCDSRFYTTATNLRDVHLDIQSHLAKHYSEKGLTEAEEFSDEELDLPAKEILQLYSRTQQPLDFEVEVINDPEQVNLINQAIEQRAFLKTIGQMIAMGFIPTQAGWETPMHDLGHLSFDLKRAIGNVLRPFYYDDEFEVLKSIVDKGDVMISELQNYTRSVIQNTKGA